MSGSVGTTSKRSIKRGSEFSDKQVAYAVRDRRQVIAHMSGGVKITGYIFGSDDYHWGIVGVTAAETVLVHKSSVCLVISSLDSEPPERVRELTEPFRAYVMEKFFGKTQTPSATS